MLLLSALNDRKELISRKGALAIRRYLEGSSPAQWGKKKNCNINQGSSFSMGYILIVQDKIYNRTGFYNKSVIVLLFSC